ncbi:MULTISPECIES: methyl-accepting chemotaxis protein [unclassified Coleofasciculus]|uniref:methyl-accepting chemotaxis protein n=1 Tax=unclassified Coleofasciculus TaxID=2692782 RepID=UPI001883114C|nr:MULTISPECIES: methyl-accepting chemotaxis protein [unclassified Coleofasciculus]MBE9125617.1 type IV pili methyl-accepting chemotaxis transducer N-terminal domain-containing protein [Coleofasciculus sp. LEGE 07081]MBE9147331.1 type IV pili methyl-accepting chemotaxis transducer N-terminal domain-containing protein [Coleofasciculus sp. LEGE 07092]
MNNVINQLRLAIIMLAVFAIFNLVAIYRQIDSMSSDSRIVNYAGIVRGKTQRLMKLELSSQDTGSIISELDQIIKGLIDGDEELKLVNVRDRDFQSNMQKIEQDWDKIKLTLKDLRSNPSDQNQERIIKQSEDYWDLTNATVSSAEDFAKRHVQNSKNLAIILFFANLVVLAAIWKLSQNIKLRLKKTVNILASSSSEISTTLEEQERVASQQATSVNEITTTMDELEASSRQSAEQAKAAVTAAQRALKLTEGGTEAVGETLDGMYTLEDKVGAIAEQIVRLSEQANQIGSISQLVSDLANKTNMLALNSSVEAVRAGEHGKGFSVVANEIRKLADQSQQSADKIGLLVSEIQSAINSTVMVTDEGTKTVTAGVKVAQKTNEAFAGVADAVDKVVLNNQQISLNLKQQVDAIQQVVQAMDTINKGAKETANGINQTKVGTQQLNESALDLKQMV